MTYRLKKKYRDGTEKLLFSPMELMEKLAALIPKLRRHAIRYHGLFAPHSKNRHKIVLGKPKAKSEGEIESGAAEKKEKSDSRMSWAKLLNRVFKVGFILLTIETRSYCNYSFLMRTTVKATANEPDRDAINSVNIFELMIPRHKSLL